MNNLIAHPLTNAPAYTASNWRKAINAALTPTDGTAFGSLQGIRAGAPQPLCTISGLTITIKPHTGIINPFPGEGAYTYTLTKNQTIDIQSSTQNYKLALALEDPSVGHGSQPQLTATLYTYGTPDSSIPGITLAEIKSGVISDTAPIIAPQALLFARSKEQLNTITAYTGQKAKIIGSNEEYTYNNGVWVSVTRTKSIIQRLPYQTGGAYTLTREGNIVTLGGQGTCDNVQNAGNLKVNEAIPAGYRPTAPMSVSWGGNQKMDMLIKPDGTITLLGNAYGWVHIGASWITHDPMPN
ncbi:hypothetical protein QP104_07295 [Alloscardovia omnicolens]|uniref:hypothetical protein n=1 Tax=Alloscardovia omnicolens TaxID=419015 RepID=UPI00254F0E9F|nr:hypothetical protein [Alloscardovia omnicolens]MDK6445717.1 hypothetical protein [Alloscardovia omnicolens]